MSQRCALHMNVMTHTIVEVSSCTRVRKIRVYINHFYYTYPFYARWQSTTLEFNEHLIKFSNTERAHRVSNSNKNFVYHRLRHTIVHNLRIHGSIEPIQNVIVPQLSDIQTHEALGSQQSKQPLGTFGGERHSRAHPLASWQLCNDTFRRVVSVGRVVRPWPSYMHDTILPKHFIRFIC